MFYKIALFLCAIVVCQCSKDLPATFKKCKRSDVNFSKCLVTAINDALPKMKDGLPEYGLLPIDPLAVNTLSIQQGANSPINLKQEYKNIKIIHVSDSVVKKFNADLENFILRGIVHTPQMEFIGDYSMDGRILVLPIQGNGRSNITMIDLTTKHELIGEPYKKNGELYFRLKQYKIKFEPKKVELNFENLFNGDKALGENMNKFLNQNWEVVFNELVSGYEDTFGLVFKEVTNKLFTKVPMNKIFLE